MRPGEIVSIALFFGAIAGLTAISSKKIGEADREAALAEAIKAEFHWVPGVSVYAKYHAPLKRTVKFPSHKMILEFLFMSQLIKLTAKH